MEKVPQIVIVRLKVGSLPLQHPDADTLTAFAERSLSSSKRDPVLEHLAHCGECREIVALALPATEPTQVIVRPTPKAWLTWPAIRWGAIAAGLLAVGSLGIVYYQRHLETQVALTLKASPELSEAKNVPLAQETRNEGNPALPSPRAPKQAEHRDLKQSQEQQQADALKLDYATSSPLAQQKAPTVMRVMPAASDKDASAQGPGAPPSPTPAQNGLTSALAEQRANSDASPGLQAESPRGDEAYRLARVEKSKPAVPTAPPSTARASGASVGGPLAAGNLARTVSVSPASVVQWSITSTGALQRSLDQGNTWQTVDVNRPGTAGAPAFEALDKKATSKTESSPIVFRTVTVNGTDVWAGAQNGILYRSSDAGIHWSRVIPQVGGTSLTGDIVSLEFTARHGRIVTSAPEIWITSDAGQTWQKQ